jgi:hypothetical protein
MAQTISLIAGDASVTEDGVVRRIRILAPLALSDAIASTPLWMGSDNRAMSAVLSQSERISWIAGRRRAGRDGAKAWEGPLFYLTARKVS